MEIKLKNLKYSFKCLSLLIKKKPSYLFLSIISIIDLVLFHLIPINIVDKIVDGFIKGKEYRELIDIVLLNTIIIIVISIIQQVITYLKNFIKSQFSLEFQTILFRKLQRIDYEFYHNANFLDNYTRALDGGADMIYEVANEQMNAIHLLISSLSILAIIFTISWIAVLYAIFVSILYMFIRKKCGILAFNKMTDDRPFARLEWSITRVFYVKDAIPDMKTTNITDVMLDEHRDLTQKRIGVYNKYTRKKTVYDIIGSILMSSIYPIILLFVAISVVNTKDIAKLSSLTVAALTITNCIVELISVLTNIQINALEARVSFEILEMDSNIESKGGKDVDEKLECLEVNNISFSYEKGHNTIDNVSFKINKGDKIAIVGTNGAGKTTLVRLLLRLYDVNEGSINYNKTPYVELDPKKLRKKVGAVFQNPEVYSVTIGENVLLRKLETEEDRKIVIEALKFADIYDYIMTLPDGIDTLVTREFAKEGAIFSGGQMQKMAVARGYAQNYDILLLDEPSSKLDPIAETKMYKNMLEMGEGKTLLFISHRLSATVNCDKIFLFEHGKIVEQGTHKELMGLKNGKYKEMFISQAEKYLEEE